MLVSIYIPTKNRLDMLQAAIESVLKQTHREVEVIVVDDASTDGTKAYLTELSDKDTRVKFLSNSQSRGACVARNMAIMHSQGEFVTGLDDDDEFEPYHIEALVNYWQILKKTNVPFACIYVQNKYRTQKGYTYSHKLSSVTHENMFQANHVGNQIFSTKENYIQAGLFNEVMPAWQDLEFFYRFLKKHGTAKLLDVCSYIVDVAPRVDRISIASKRRILDASIKFISAHLNDLNNSNKLQLLRQIYSANYGFKLSMNDLFYFHKAKLNNVILAKLILIETIKAIRKSYLMQKLKPFIHLYT